VGRHLKFRSKFRPQNDGFLATISVKATIIGTPKFGYTETWRIYSATHQSDSECTWYIECTGTPFH
jgi:hypothetical protein